MPPSRRAAVGLIAGAVLPLTAGCSNVGAQLGTSDSDPPANDEDGDAAFAVWLSGPGGEQLLFDGSDVATVGEVSQGRNGRVHLPITLTDDGTATVSERFRTAGVAENLDAFEVRQRIRGEVVFRASVAPRLSETITSGDWEGEMLLVLEDRAQADTVREAIASCQPH